jgi:hypothetical protein
MDATRTTPLRERMRQELQLAGLSERTQEAYLRSVRQLATHFGKPPDQVTEPELRQYLLLLLLLKNEKHFAPASLKIAFYGIRFFFRTTAPRDWPTLQELRIPDRRRSSTTNRETLEPLPKRARVRVREAAEPEGAVVGPVSGLLEQRIAGPATRPAIHVYVRPRPRASQERLRWAWISSCSASSLKSSLRPLARRASTVSQSSGGERYAELAGSRRARAMELIETPAASAISSAVMRRVRISVAVLKSTCVRWIDYS